MKCSEVERLVIESSSERLDEGTKKEMARHMNDCACCARLEEDMAGIRTALLQQHGPALPRDLDERTHRLCLAELAAPRRKGEKSAAGNWLKSIPASIKAAFIFIIVLTAIWAVPLLKEVKLEESLSVAAIIMFSMIVQNAVMLIFSPLLLRRIRTKKSRMESCSTG